MDNEDLYIFGYLLILMYFIILLKTNIQCPLLFFYLMVNIIACFMPGLRSIMFSKCSYLK